MDLHKAFVSAVIASGVEGYKSAQEKGIVSEFLGAPARDAWDFIAEYYSNYKELPSVEVIAGKTGVRLGDPPKEPVGFFIDEVLNLRLHMQVGQKVETVAGLLSGRRPQEAYEAYSAGLRDLRKEGIAVSKTLSLPALGPDFLEYYDLVKSGHRGIETPWPTVNDSTMGFWPEDFVLYVARLGVGKCVAAETEIVDPVSGVPVSIQELCENPSYRTVITWSTERGLHEAPITAKIDSGVKECYEFMVSATGRKVTVTPEHPFLTPAGWKRADTLTRGDLIALPANMPFPDSPVSRDLNELALVAICMCLGTATASNLSYSSSDPWVTDLAKRSVAALGLILLELDGYEIFSSDDGLWVGKFGRIPNPHHEPQARVPNFVWRLDEQGLIWFLAVLWRCCGVVRSGVAEVTFLSESFVRGLQSLFLRFGVQTRVRWQQDNANTWTLQILSSHLRKFALALLSVGITCPEISSLLEKDVWSRSFTIDASSAALDGPVDTKKQGFWSKVWGFFTRRRGGELSSELNWVRSPDLYWDSIGSIRPVGETRIFDLTVAPSACFVANDILVHNTWTLVQVMLHAWFHQKKRVLFVTTEMSREKILQRTYALHFKLPYDDLRRGRLSEFAEKRFREGVVEMKDMEGLYIVGGGFDFTMDSLEAAIEEAEPDLCVIDGAYLIKTSGDGRMERAANSFDELKRCAKRNKIPLVASTQFNREAKTNSSDSVSVEKIALSDAAGWNADLIFGLVQTEEMRMAGRMVQKPLKFREGVGEDVLCHWNFQTMDFSEIQKDADVSSSSTHVRKDSSSGFLFSGKSDVDDDDDDPVPF